MKRVKSTERIIAILQLVANASSPLTANDLFKRTGYPRSSLHLLLLTPKESSWIDQASNGTFRIGANMFLCGVDYLDSDPVTEHVSAVLENVRNTTSFTTKYARLERSDVIYLPKGRVCTPAGLHTPQSVSFPLTLAPQARPYCLSLRRPRYCSGWALVLIRN